VHGRKDVLGEVGLDRLPALLRDPELPAEERLRCDRAQADQHARLDDREFGVEPRPARSDLRPVRLLVDPPLPARSPFEVLDRVGDVDLRAIDPASSSASSKSLPAGPTKGLPALSSWSPGCSPTNITFALRVPSPKTVWVASL
jgi:hypothetical protein